MNKLSKFVFFIAVLCAIGYAFHRFQTCQIVGVKQGETRKISTPTGASPDPTNAPPNGSALVYPTVRVLSAMKLGYDIFSSDDHGGVTALPLPPGAALRTMFVIYPSGHRSFSLKAADSRCSSAINVEIYRFDTDKAVLSGKILPSSNKTLLVNLDTLKLSDPSIIAIGMASGAKNNWFCNIQLEWDNH